MRPLRTVLTLLLATSAATACGPGTGLFTPAPEKPQGEVYEVAFPEQHGRVANGVRFIVLPDPSTDLVQVDVHYSVGSVDDPKGKAGLAHLVEHMTFQQRPRGPEQPPLGVLLEEVTLASNAATTWDSTVYTNLARKENLEEVIALEATRLRLGCTTIPDAELPREREVVRNELRLRYAQPAVSDEIKLHAAIYPAGHPYRRFPGGDDAQVSALELADVCGYVNDHYVPERVTIVIAGNTNAEKVAGYLGRHVAHVPARAGAAQRPVPPALPGGRKQLTLGWEDPALLLAFPMPAAFSDDEIGTQLALMVLTEALEERADRGLYTDVTWTTVGGPRAPVAIIDVTLVGELYGDKALAHLEKSIEEIIDSAEDSRYSAEGTWKIRAMMASLAISGLETLEERTGVYAAHQQFHGTGSYLRRRLEQVTTFDPESLPRMLQRFRNRERLTVVVSPGPRTAGYAESSLSYAPTGDSHRNRLATPGDAVDQPMPLPENLVPAGMHDRFELDNGLEVILVRREGGLPLMAAALFVRAGAAHEPRRRAGILGYYVQEPGSADGAGTSVIGNLASDYMSFAILGPTHFAGRLLDALAYADNQMTPPGIYRDELTEDLVRPDELGRRTGARLLRRALFGADHPYVWGGDPTLDSIEWIDQKGLRAMRAEYFGSRNCTLVIVGNFDRDYIVSYVHDRFGKRGEGQAAAPVRPTQPMGRVARAVVGATTQPTLHVSIAYATPTFDDDHATRLVVAAMVEEAMEDIREELAASYGLSVGLVTRSAGGALIVSGDVDRRRAGEALAAMRARLTQIATGDGIGAAFARARRRVVGQLLTTFADPMAFAASLAYSVVYRLPLDFEEKTVRRVAGVTLADVMRVAARDLDASREVIILEGTKEDTVAAFKTAGVTDYRVVTPKAPKRKARKPDDDRQRQLRGGEPFSGKPRRLR